MKKTVLFSLAFSLIFLLSSCKSKQRVVQITGADIEAAEAVETVTETVIENERTIDEKFTLSEGDQDTFYKTYHVVVGSFSIEKNAKNLKNTLQREGNNAIVVVNETGMYRVIIASYDSYAEAKNRIVDISGRFVDAWVLRQK